MLRGDDRRPEARHPGGARGAVCRATRLWTDATSLGGTESTLERRGRYDLDAPLCAPGFLRLSVGIEDAGDLWEDLATALDDTRPD